MPDTQNRDELPRSVFCDEFIADFSSLGAPATTVSRDAWCQRSNCWLVVGFYDDVAVRTPEGWRLSSVKLTVTHQENEALLAASMAAVKD